MDQVIILDKSFQVRMEEYSDVLGRSNEVLSVACIKKEWTNFLELSMDPSGWQAVWKVPRLTCELLAIPYPAIILIYIQDVDFDELTATAKVIAVQDDISLPEIVTVPIIQVWPTKTQDPTVVLNLKTTANALDMVRFFYMNLFMPWDVEDDYREDWVEKHLESRLRLFYDMKNGVIARGTAEHLRGLLTESRRLQAKKEYLEKQFECNETDSDVLNADSDGKEVDIRMVELMDINLSLLQISSEVEVLESPLLRETLIRRQTKTAALRPVKYPSHWLIFDDGKVDDYLVFLNKVKELFPTSTDVMSFAPSLGPTLENLNVNDVIILNKGFHFFRTTGGLEYGDGSVLRGIYSVDDTILKSVNETIMFGFAGNDILVENVTIDATFANCAILIRRGNTTLRDCKIIGDFASSTHQGIIVLKGSSLELINCEISGFSEAVIGNTGAKIKLHGCHIHSVSTAVKTYDNCDIEIKDCEFSNCAKFGISVEMEKNVNGLKIGSGNFDILTYIPGLTIEQLTGKNNGKANAVIHHMSKIHPVLDLFPNKNGDKKASVSSAGEDEDMKWEDNQANETVIANETIVANSAAENEKLIDV